MKLWKKISQVQKKWLQERSCGTFSAEFFSYLYLLIDVSNHTVFLIQFEINLCLWVSQKAEIYFTVQINSELNSKLYDYVC